MERPFLFLSSQRDGLLTDAGVDADIEKGDLIGLDGDISRELGRPIHAGVLQRDGVFAGRKVNGISAVREEVELLEGFVAAGAVDLNAAGSIYFSWRNGGEHADLFDR